MAQNFMKNGPTLDITRFGNSVKNVKNHQNIKKNINILNRENHSIEKEI